ncbi:MULTISPECIES: hypothetical protein [unclassified Wolbachia]|uniref:hypothetical protein n=1 Tax=unclassified Wolbachia TaxID=2640676 RepID=UPI001AE872F6|nr:MULTISPECIES: hypothetical protein [unclassified Wolbachia]MCA7010952.1 hypothetical protein [Wolbachia endosymbiont of Tribolium confusum]QTP61653.1 hypothetical protein HUB92_01600 [Wolbachia endosymbiont of Wiebesia pumilae]
MLLLLVIAIFYLKNAHSKNIACIVEGGEMDDNDSLFVKELMICLARLLFGAILNWLLVGDKIWLIKLTL